MEKPKYVISFCLCYKVGNSRICGLKLQGILMRVIIIEHGLI